MAHAGQEVDQDRIDRVAYQRGRGIYGHHKGAIATAAEFGFEARSCYLKGHPEADLEAFLALMKERPLLVTGRFHMFPEEAGSAGHAVVVLGSTEDGLSLAYHDPHHRKAASGDGVAQLIGVPEFFSRWSLQHMGWALWVKGPTDQ